MEAATTTKNTSKISVSAPQSSKEAPLPQGGKCIIIVIARASWSRRHRHQSRERESPTIASAIFFFPLQHTASTSSTRSNVVICNSFLLLLRIRVLLSALFFCPPHSSSCCNTFWYVCEKLDQLPFTDGECLSPLGLALSPQKTTTTHDSRGLGRVIFALRLCFFSAIQRARLDWTQPRKIESFFSAHSPGCTVCSGMHILYCNYFEKCAFNLRAPRLDSVYAGWDGQGFLTESLDFLWHNINIIMIILMNITENIINVIFSCIFFYCELKNKTIIKHKF